MFVGDFAEKLAQRERLKAIADKIMHDIATTQRKQDEEGKDHPDQSAVFAFIVPQGLKPILKKKLGPSFGRISFEWDDEGTEIAQFVAEKHHG